MNGMHPWTQALAWTLVHFLWQGALLGVAAWLLLTALARRSPGLRYTIACAGLALMALAPVATFLILLPKGSAGVPLEVRAADSLYAMPAPGLLVRAQAALQPWLPSVLLFWIGGAALLALRLGGGLWMVHRLKRDGVRPAPGEWHLVLSRLARAMGIRRTVRLLKSARVEAPMVAGWIRPVILLPLSAFTQLSPAQLEAVLAHELAHIRRCDFLINVLQAGIETLLFYHPAVWWLSARIREERELCCDDAAVGLCKDALDYARALTLLETHRTRTPSLALSSHGGPLMNRIHRLIQPQLLPSPRLKSLMLAGLALSALGASAYALQEKPGQAGKKAQSFQIIDDGRRLSVKSEGDVTLQPDQKDMVIAGKDGKFRLSEKKDGKTWRYEVDGGKRAYIVDGKEQPMDAEGEAWLRGSLQDMEKMKAQAREGREEAMAHQAEAKVAMIDARQAQAEARKAMEEARRVQVKVTEENGKKRIVVMRDGKVETDDVIDIPDIKVEEKDGKKHIIVRQDGKIESDDVIEIPKMQMFRDGKRQRIIVEKDGETVEDHLIDLPEMDFKDSTIWNWDDEDEPEKRFMFLRPGSSDEVDRLKAEVEALRKQVEELERQVGKTPKPPVLPKTK